MTRNEIENVLLQHLRVTRNTYIPNPKTNSMSIDLDSVREAADALAAKPDGWQPIETAESDEPVLVCNPAQGRMPVLAWKVGSSWYEYGVYAKSLRPAPTHWMKWPRLPRPEQGESK